MGLLELIADARRRRPAAELAWPVGRGSVEPFESLRGHDDSRFSPESYGDYAATSNEVNSAISLRARLMSGLGVPQLFRGRGSDKAEVTSGPVNDLLRWVNPFWTWPRLARMDEMSMGLWGEAYWVIEREGRLPSNIWWVKPSRMHPRVHESEYVSEFLYEPAMGGDVIPFRPDEVIWFRYPNPIDEFSALSPLAAARLAADTASSMMRSNRNLFSQGLQMGGLIVPDTDKVTFSSEQAEELEKLLDRRYKGVDQAHRWAVLRYEAQFRAMGVTPKDAEFVNGLNLTLRQVCNAYGIPSPLLNDLEHATLANAREFQQILWAHALVPDACLKAGEIAEQLLPMFPRSVLRGSPDHAEFDFSTVPALQESASASWDRERQAIEVGGLTINEWRKSKGLPPVPWGDVWWAPVNKSAVSDATSAPQGDTAPPDLPTADPAVPPAGPAAEYAAGGRRLSAGEQRIWDLVLAELTPDGSDRR